MIDSSMKILARLRFGFRIIIEKEGKQTEFFLNADDPIEIPEGSTIISADFGLFLP